MFQFCDANQIVDLMSEIMWHRWDWVRKNGNNSLENYTLEPKSPNPLDSMGRFCETTSPRHEGHLISFWWWGFKVLYSKKGTFQNSAGDDITKETSISIKNIRITGKERHFSALSTRLTNFSSVLILLYLRMDLGCFYRPGTEKALSRRPDEITLCMKPWLSVSDMISEALDLE